MFRVHRFRVSDLYLKMLFKINRRILLIYLLKCYRYLLQAGFRSYVSQSLFHVKQNYIAGRALTSTYSCQIKLLSYASI